MIGTGSAEAAADKFGIIVAVGASGVHVGVCRTPGRNGVRQFAANELC